MSDPTAPVDCAKQALHIGDYIYVPAVIVGFRVDENNRLNIWAQPAFDAIQTNNPTNPLNDHIDGSCILISGYHCWTGVDPSGITALSLTPSVIGTIKGDLKTKADALATVTLPSNFMAPDFV